MFFPIDLERYRRWTARMLFRLIYPELADNFVHKQDHQIHLGVGNLVAPTSGGPVTYVVPSNTSVFADALRVRMRAELEQGDAEIEIAQETGEFTGV